jgi:hypothetical protein
VILPCIVIVFVAAIWAMSVYFAKRSPNRTFWRTALLIGLGIGVARAVLASIGWYTTEHTGGPLQIPGFLLGMLAWPELALLPRQRRTTPAPLTFFVGLSALLIGSSVLFVAAIVGFARFVTKRPK